MVLPISARTNGVLHGAVMAGANMKPTPTLRTHSLYLGWGDVKADTGRFQRVGTAGFRGNGTVAVFGYVTSGCGSHKHGCG